MRNIFRRRKPAVPDRVATLNKPDAMLRGYLFARALADGQRLNCDAMLDENGVADLFVGVTLAVGALVNLIANDNGLSLAEADEQLIGVLMLEGASS